jgi:hypothetical protein
MRLRSSLHGHAFRQVPGLVDFTATQAGDVVGEELERDDGGDGGDERVAARDSDEVVHALGGLVVALGDDAEDAGTASAAFFDIAESFVLTRDVHGEGDDGGAFFKQGDGAVLEFGGVIALGMDVGNLLELECPFEGDGIHRPATDEIE